MWKRKSSKPSEEKAIKVSPTHIKPVARPANRPAAHSSAVKKAGEISVEKPAVVGAAKTAGGEGKPAEEKSSGSTVKIERSGVVAGNAPGAPKVGEVIAPATSGSSSKAEAKASKDPKVEGKPHPGGPKEEDAQEAKKPKAEEKPLGEKPKAEAKPKPQESKPEEKLQPSALVEAQKVQSTQIEKKQETAPSTRRLSRGLVFETTVGVIFSLAIAGLLGFFMMGGSF
ncbi:hypothetical protein [Corynebacterium anserum]|uniref:Uncharacterized protein n=1 Tax=Corynebacterium anserum TaxID=2684406 RepID=A0A7G7YLH5_9CORY|nr:hypothetical protein [Corynebacterium anserum]QNH95345.1 hypothetical protein GP473_00290 [Corynebacterium anserum]